MSKEFEGFRLELEGLQVIERSHNVDDRGFFSRLFCENEFINLGIIDSIKQINHSFTKKKGTIRGMHFQISPYEEIKIVSCLKGKVYDVAVDIRKDSPTYLNWHAEILTANKKTSFVIPKGFAHGFQSLTDNCELIYLHSEFYNRNAENALNAFDPKLDISWPLKVTNISDRDRNHSLI